ncbi:hypothetical protein C1147_08120 [Clostridium botulinum]|nr:hypothetical protein C1147_08120 [Clostridium botulinum]RFM21045.1 hypothetical protein C1146_12800 [Clostridium botulinum]
MNTEVWFRNKQLLLKMSTYLGSYHLHDSPFVIYVRLYHR